MKKLSLCLASAATLWSNPENPVVISGEVNFDLLSETNLQITTSDRSIIEWEKFSIDKGELTHFVQPSASSAVLNRVTGGSISHLLGTLRSNGAVYLVNPAGFVIGKDAMVDTASLVVSTLDILNDQFLNQTEIVFSGTSTADIIHEGIIQAAINHETKADAMQSVERGGRVYLVADKGVTLVSGEITGSEIKLLGQQVGLVGNGLIDVSSSEGNGGEVFIGNTQTSYAYIGTDASIKADATVQGNGGRVIVWGEDAMVFLGSITARGEGDGNGGFVELSGHGGLLPKGRVDTTAPNGKIGTLLFDPIFVTISAAATTVGVTPPGPPGACPLPAQNYGFNTLSTANISLGDIVGFLACNNVTINAAASGARPAGSGYIQVVAGLGGFTWATAAKLTLISDNTIEILSDINCSHGGFSVDTVAMDFQAPNIYIGKPEHDLAAALFITSSSGQINISAPVSFTLSGGAGANTAQIISSNVLLNAGSVTIESGPAGGSITRIIATNDFTANITGDTLVQALGSGAGITTAGAGPANINIVSNGNITLQGGTGTMATAGISGGLGTLGNLNCTIQGDYNVTGGAASIDGNTFIGLQNSGDVTLSGRNFVLTGGNSTVGTNNAFIGSAAGNVSLTATGVDGITLNGGTASNCAADFLVFGTGDLFITTTNLTLNGSTTPGTTNSPALIQVTGGDLTIHASGDLNLNGSDIGTMSGATINSGGNVEILARSGSLKAGMMSNTPATVIGPGNVTIGIQNDLSLRGGIDALAFAVIGSTGDGTLLDLQVGGDFSAFAPFGGSASVIQLSLVGSDIHFTAHDCSLISDAGGSATFLSSAGNIVSSITGDYIIQTGSSNGMPPFGGELLAGFMAAHFAGFGNLTMTGQSYLINAGSGFGTFAGFMVGQGITMMGSGGNGSIDITAGPGGIVLNAGDGLAALAGIFTFGTASTNNITINSLGNITLNGSTVAPAFGLAVIDADLGGQIQITSGGNITLNGGDPINIDFAGIGNNFFSGVGGGLKPIVLSAGKNISLNDGGVVQNLETGGITLIADARRSTPPEIGRGGLFTTPGATINTIGPLLIFTSERSHNNIQSPLSGVPYISGAEFVNTDTEMWGIYSPHNSGFPYTIFYKNISVPGRVLSNFSTAVSEALRDWSMYDTFIINPVSWNVSYDHESYKSSKLRNYARLPEEKFTSLRTFHRNYHTLTFVLKAP